MARFMPKEMREALTGSRAGDRVRVDAWFDGRLIADDLPVSSWSYSEALDQKIKGQFSCTLADVDPALVPVALGDDLSPAGARLSLSYECGEWATDFARMVVTKATPNITRRVLDGQVLAVSGVVGFEADDLTETVDSDRLLAPFSPSGVMTVEEVFAVLVDDLLPVVFDAGTDPSRKVPSSVVFERERLDALEDLAGMAGGFLRMGGDGTLHVCPTEPTGGPVAEVVGGERGCLITTHIDLSMDGVYNAVVSSSSPGGKGDVYVASAFQEDGPLRFGGPAGRRVLFHSSPLINSVSEARLDAETTLRNRVGSRFINVDIECLPNPAVQVGDLVSFASLLDGTSVEVADLVGRVMRVDMSGDSHGVHPAKWVVSIPMEAYRRLLGG